MKVVLDTNVILRALSTNSEFAIFLDLLFLEKYTILVDTEILLEYEEKIILFFGQNLAKDFLDFLILLPNVIKTESFFKLNLIKTDLDDNKFVDCAFSGNAHYIVTDDRHFNILKKIDFPKISVINASEFKTILLKL